MITSATESHPKPAGRLRARIHGYGLLILATLLFLAPTMPGFAQDIYHVSIDGTGNLLIEDQTPGGTSDFLSIDLVGGDVVITDLSNTFENPTANPAITVVNDNEVNVDLSAVTGSILVDMSDGMDKIEVGSGIAVPRNISVASLGDLEVVEADVDGDFLATATDIYVTQSGGGINTLNGGNVALITTTSTVVIDDLIHADGELTIQGSIVDVNFPIGSVGVLKILQPGNGVMSLTVRLNGSTYLDSDTAVIIGDNQDGGDVTIVDPGAIISHLLFDIPVTAQTKGTLRLNLGIVTLANSAATITLRGNEVRQIIGSVQADGALYVLQPGDGSTALTLFHLGSSSISSDEEVIVGDRTDGGDVTIGDPLSPVGPLLFDVPFTAQTKGTLRWHESIVTLSPSGADVTLRGNEVRQTTGSVQSDGTLYVLQPGDGSTALTLYTLGSSSISSDVEVIVGDRTDGGDVTIGDPLVPVPALLFDVPFTAQTKGSLRLHEPIVTLSPSGADITLRGNEVRQTTGFVDADGTLQVLQPGDGLTSLTFYPLGAPGTLLAGVAVIIGDEFDAGDVTVDGSNIVVDVELYVRSGGSVNVSSSELVMIGPHPIWIVGGGSGSGSANFIGNLVAVAPALGTLVDGGAGDDAFTFGGVAQSLDGLQSSILVDGKAGEDTIILDDSQDNTKNVYTLKTGEVVRNGGAPIVDHVRVEGVDILGGVKDDELVVDFSMGNPVAGLTGGMLFDGGDQNSATGDVITLQGGAVSPLTHYFADAHSGSIDFDGVELSYLGLEPIFDNLTVANRVFTFLGGDESITLEDDGAANGLSKISSTLGETVIFTNPTSSLTVNTGTGDDVFLMTDPDAIFDMSVPVTINGDGGEDTFTIDLLPPFTAPVEVNGQADADLFIVTPRVGATTIKGGAPTTYPGDVLDLDLAKHGAMIESFISGAPDHRDGSWTFVGALDDVDFVNIEEQLDYSDVKVKIAVNNDEPTVGATVIYTVTAKNLLPGHSTGLKLNVPVSTMGQRFLKADAGMGEYDPATGIWTIGELLDSETAKLEIHSQIRVFRQITMFAEVLEVDQFDPNSTPNNIDPGENDYDEVLVTPNPIETPGPNDFFHPTSVEGTSFATLAVSPHDPTAKAGPSTNYLFAGSTDGGLHRSSDGGANWPRVGLKDKIIRSMSISSLTGAIYVGDYGEGMYRSSDDGLTFTDINTGLALPGDRRVIASTIDEFAPRTGADGDVYIGTDGGGIFLSTDDGANWQDVNNGLGNKIVRALLVVENGSGGAKEQIYAGTLGGGVYTLKEGDPSWSSANGTGAVKLGDKYVYALVESKLTGAIYAGTGDGIYKTVDKGTTWTLVLADTPTRAFATYVDAGVEYIFAGTDGEYVQVTKDDGATWFEQNIGIDDRTVEVVLVTDDGILFAGTATQGIFRSDDLGKNWYRVTSFMQNAVIQAMTFDDQGELYVGTYGFGVFHTDDAMNFTRVNTGLDNHWVFALAHTPGDALFAGTWNKGVYRSLDDARTWQFVGLPYRIVYDFAVRDAYTIYAATDRGEVARSVDNGLTWHEVGVATTAIYALAIDPTDPNTIYAGTFGAGTYKSTDGGNSFTKTGMPDTYVFDFAFDPLTGDLWAATSMGPMFSSDAGASWTLVVGGLDNVDTRAIVFNDMAVPLIGTWGGGVSRYDELAGEWIAYGLTDMPILAFAISPIDGDLYAGTDGMGVFRRTFGVMTGREKDVPTAEVPTAYALGQNYPNPFNPITTLSFDLPESGYARLVVYDMVGREVRVVVDGTLNAGRHEMRMDAADLPSGVYLYRLDTNGQSFTKKMVLMK